MSLHRDDAGATMTEYAALLSLVVLVAFIAVQAFGGSVLGLFRSAVDVMP
jgi:Flp pilus assembly pilin Flp